MVHGAIDPDMFRAVSGEMLAVYCKVEHMIDELREVQNPSLYRNIEQVVADWPGAEEIMGRFREYFKAWRSRGHRYNKDRIFKGLVFSGVKIRFEFPQDESTKAVHSCF
ncbi:MAG: hypothetical protein CM1200mP14_21660 [Gammaproteobacteria bacterium]|nr:MAG: hypothetical protein CM1200mP14_21660 [Gammaproteobacteria bacterium]